MSGVLPQMLLCCFCLPVDFKCFQILSFVVISMDLMGMVILGCLMIQDVIPILYLITYPCIGWGILSMGGFGIISLNILLVQIYRLGNVVFLKYQFWFIVICESIIKLAFCLLFMVLAINYSPLGNGKDYSIKPFQPSLLLQQQLKDNFENIFIITTMGIIYSIYTFYILYSVENMLDNLQDVISAKIKQNNILFTALESVKYNKQKRSLSKITPFDDSPFKSRSSSRMYSQRVERKSVVGTFSNIIMNQQLE